MKAPKKVMELVEKKVEEKRERKESKKRAEEREREKFRKLRELKGSQSKELMEISYKITNWLKEFFESFDGIEILDVAGSINVFLAKFWLGESITKQDRTCWAVIALKVNGEIVYQEKHEARVSKEISLGRIYESIGLPVMLYDNLHPDFLRQWLYAIETGKVWDRIEMELKRK